MKSIISIYLLMLLIVLYGKSAEFNYYPNEFNKYSSDSLNSMKYLIFEKLNSESLKLDYNNEEFHKVTYLLNRIAVIEWSSTQRTQICTFLSDFYKKLTTDEKFIKTVNNTNFELAPLLSDYRYKHFNPFSPIWLPVRIAWLTLKIKKDYAEKMLYSIWQDAIESSKFKDEYKEMLVSDIFVFINHEHGYENDQIDKFVQEKILNNGYKLRYDEKYKENRKLYNLNAQKKAKKE